LDAERERACTRERERERGSERERERKREREDGGGEHGTSSALTCVLLLSSNMYPPPQL